MNNNIKIDRFANFPLLSPEEFSREIRTFASQFLDERNVPFTFVTADDDETGIFDSLEYLNFQAIATFSERHTGSNEEEDLDLAIEEGDESDEEALPRLESSLQARSVFEFSIVHSPVSLLPQLLYRPSQISLTPIPSSARVTLAFPAALTSPIEHPVTGKTEGWRFVHGCEGRTVMTALRSIMEEGVAGYLEVWLGAIGVGWAIWVS